jgi:hypothetical protein
MKTILTAAALAFASIGAFAQEATLFDDAFVAQKSRAEVRAEVHAALARGEQLNFGEARTTLLTLPMSTRTRAEVMADLFGALARGEAIRHGEAPPAGNYDTGRMPTALAHTPGSTVIH